MIAYEALNTTPTPKANLKQDNSKQDSTFSFESMLKSITKKEKTDAETALIVSPKEDNTKTQLLNLLKNSSATQNETDTHQTIDLKKEEEQQNTQINTLLKLLKSNTTQKNKEIKTAVEINPDISNKLSTTELKYLIYKAKKYLKEKIEANPEFSKKYDPKDLPNNLKSLITIAKELKINIKNITYENIETQPFLPKDKKQDDIFENKIDKKLKIEKKEPIEQVTKQETKITTKESLNTKETIKENIAIKLSSLKNTPIVKEVQNTTVTTQHIIQTKKTKNTTKQEMTQSDLLKKLLKRSDKKENILLQQTKSSQQQNIEDLFQEKTQKTDNFDKDTKNTKQTLEELLRNETNTQNNELKPLQTHKSDSIEVKINEAKQMMKFLSEDIKKAIDDYKPPFSRLKVQLNPQELGEIDLTVVQRGKNVHINLSSNNAALNILANNLNELKTQLNQNGIHNASFNFNSNSEQKQDQGRQKAQQQYTYFAEEEENNEYFRELEIIIPKYI